MTQKDLLIFAKHYSNHDNETERRAAVSRAYFGLFHLVKAVVVSAGITVTKDPVEHNRLARYLRNSGIFDAKFVSSKLSDLRLARNAADYDLDDRKFNNKTSCVLEYALAESTCKKLESIKSSDFRKGLRAYARLINEL